MHTITTLDDLWMGRRRSIATALLESDGHRSVVDPGPGSTLETLRKQLRAKGIGVGDLDAILLTHIHLDHAGATGALVRENPRLAVYVHKNGAPHVIDPSKLLASAQRLWPNDLQRLFGESLPVPAENLRILEGGETLTLGSRRVEVVYTPGHASHHVSYFDKAEGVAFVGDTAAPQFWSASPRGCFSRTSAIPIILRDIFCCSANGSIAGPRSPRKSCAPHPAIPQRWIPSCPPRMPKSLSISPPMKLGITLSAPA